MLRTISPITNEVIIETPETTYDEAVQIIDRSKQAQAQWAQLTLEERKVIVSRFLDLLESDSRDLGCMITKQMGRPIDYAPGEVLTAVMRGRVMLNYADEALAPVEVDLASRPKFKKFLSKNPRGVAFILFPWNYPYLTLVNGLVPALLAGNSVIIKPSPQTPQVAEAVARAFHKASNIDGLLSVVHSGNNTVIEQIVQHEDIAAVSFTGSVVGGLAIQQALVKRTIPLALELGGNDAAYVREDVDIISVADSIADGALFNSGQSCCSIERVYVHENIYDEFEKAISEVVSKYRVGDPRNPGVQLGPLVSAGSAARVRAEVDQAIEQGAKSLVSVNIESSGPAYMSPVVLSNIPSTSPILQEETFGPVVALVKVTSDTEAIELINKSQYGLTASVWTKDLEKGEDLAGQCDAGTVFLNRCDYPDPHLAWTGYRSSGRGVSLSSFGFDHWYRLKSHHLKLS